MSERKKNFERSWRLLEYLKRNTDPEHPVSRAELLKYPSMQEDVKVKETFRNEIFNIANALNCDENGSLLPPNQWKIFYKAYSDLYGDGPGDGVDEEDDESEEAEDTGAKKKAGPPVEGLYYQHTFSYEEINALIEGVLFSRSLDTKTARLLVQKIEEHLTTRFYKKGPKKICTIRESVRPGWERLRENLLLIQRAIDDGVKLSFQFNGYNRDGALVPVRPEKTVVSPYYMVADGGRYYLLACPEGKASMFIFRVDLMTEVDIYGRNEYTIGKHALDKKKVDGLPPVWDDTFSYQHLNMAYDKPVPITLRILNPFQDKDGRTWTNYTFLRDWFGDTFHYKRTETEPPYGDIGWVLCSPFAMVNWALQYSDRVEVLEPKEVREAVIEKIKRLEEKYGIDASADEKTED